MALYESVFMARQDISTRQVDTLADDFEKIIKDGGGSIERREYWGLRNLAYRINKNRKAHYVLFNIDAASDAIQEMERNMRINEDVLRYMTVRVEALRDEPSPIMQGKGDRDRDRADRRGRDDDRDTPRKSKADKKPDETKAESPGAEEKKDDAPAEAEAPEADEKKDDAPAEAEAPEADEKKDDAEAKDKPADAEAKAPEAEEKKDDAEAPGAEAKEDAT
jgi:small subunit ribosomal protein S6